jgi:nitrogen fixation NifU-like protein
MPFEMYPEVLLDHFQNPRNVGEIAGATVVVEASNPVCGDVLKLFARMESARIVEIRFLCRGCAASIACASLLTEQVAGKTGKEACAITAEAFSEALGGLPPASFHAAQLAVEALRQLVELGSRRPASLRGSA